MMRVMKVVPAFVLLNVACSDTEVEVPRSIPFERVAIDCVANTTADEVVFDTQDAWDAFWPPNTSCFDDAGDPRPPPTIDFDRRILVAIWLEGDCTYSGCPDPPLELVERIELVGDRAIVRTRPVDPADLGLCHVCFQPSEFVTVARTDLGAAHVTFE